MPVVSLPNGTELEFPDGMAESAMRDAIYRNFPEYAPKTEPSAEDAEASKPFIGYKPPMTKAAQGIGESVVAEGERLRDAVFSGVDNVRSGVNTLAFGKRANAAQSLQARLDEMQARGDGDSLAAKSLRRELKGVQQSLPRAAEWAAIAQEDAKRGSALTTTPAMQEMAQAKSFGEAWEAFKKSPYDVISTITAQSMPAVLPALVTAAVAGPAPGALAMGASSGVTEAGNSLGKFAADAGVDVTDPDALQAFFSDPENMSQAMAFAGKRAGIIATADAVSGGVAGKIIAPAMRSGVARQAVNVPAQMVVQAGLGAGGEAGAQLATEGKISSPGEVLMEAVGELGGAPLEVATFGREARKAELPVTAPMDIIAPAQTTDEAITAAAEALDMGTQSAEAVANIGRILEQANVSTSPAVPVVDTRRAAGSGSPDATPGVGAGMGTDGAGAPVAVEPAGPADTPASAAVPQGAADPLATLRDENATLRSQALQALQSQQGAVASPEPLQSAGSPATQELPAAGPAALETRGVAAAPVKGDPIDAEWSAFTPDSGTRGVPRADMPQIKAEHRGAMTNFLNARGIAHEQVEVPVTDLKPTQAEFSPAKVEKAKAFEGGDRSILISSDGHILDGHHQWLAKLDQGEAVQAIRLDAPIDRLLAEVKEFPSAQTADGAQGLAPADEQRAAFSATEAKRAAKAARLRSGSFDRNPLMAFLGKHGINSQLASEFAPGPTERRKAIVPGYGPVFRKAGMNLDLLAERAAEEGFLPPGSRDDRALYDLIQRAMRGERVAPMYAQGAAEAMGEDMNRARFEDYEAADALAPADLEDDIQAATEDPVLQAELRALLAAAEDEGIDTEAVLEKAAQITENGSQDDFNRQAIAEVSAARTGRQGPDGGARAQQGRQAAQPASLESGREDLGQASPEEGAQEELTFGNGAWAPATGPKGTEKREFSAKDAAGNIAGRLLVYRDPDGTFDVSDIGVRPEYQRQGIASKLLDAAFTETGADYFKLTTGTTGDGGKLFTTYGEGMRNGRRVVERPTRLTQALTAPTQADVLDQQDRAAQAEELDQRDQVRRESEAGADQFQLQAKDGRQDTTGDLFSQPAEPTPQKTVADMSPADLLRAAADKLEGKVEPKKPSPREAAAAAEKAREDEKRARRKESSAKASQPLEGLSVGTLPTNAEPVTVKDGVVYIGKYPAQNFDTGEDVTVPKGSTRQQVMNAIKEAGALGKRARFFGDKDDAEPMYSRTGRDQTETPEFKRWFEGSKVVDANGDPLVVYHGSPDARFVEEDGIFSTMKDRMLKYGSTPESRRSAEMERGFFFTTSRRVAQTYANPKRAFDYQAAEPAVLPVFLSIKNPLEFDAKGKHWREAQRQISKTDFIADAKNAGHDGVVIRNVRDSYDSMQTGRDPQSDVWVSFKSSQIKSADRNKGTFDPANPDIRYARTPASSGMPADAVRAIADRIAAKWTAGPSITVVQTPDDLPVADAPADAAGLMLGGRIYLVASNMESARKVQETIAHEAIAHHGLREMLGRDGWKQLMDNIQVARRAGNKTLREISDYVRQRYVDGQGRFNLSERQEADEIAARAVETAVDPETGEFRPGLGFLKAAWSKIADFLRNIGIDISFTNAELQGLLVRAMRGLETGKKTEPAPEAVPAYALAEGDPEQNALRALSENDDLFALPKSDKDTVEGIAADNDPSIKVRESKIGSETLYVLTMPSGEEAKLWVRPANPYGEQIYSMDLVDGDTSNVEIGRPGDNPEDVDPAIEDVYLDVSNLQEGGHGNRLYNIAATFAHNTGRIFIGDPSGLSDVAMRRRLENMISTALKFGTTDHIAPHPRQVKGDAKLGIPALKWVYGDSLGNIRRMIDASLKAEETGALPKYIYDTATGNLSAAETSGRPVAEKPWPAGGSVSDVSGAPQQRGRTGARAAIFRALLRETGGSVQGEARGRDGLLAKLVSFGNQYPETTKGIFYARTGVSTPGQSQAQPTQTSPWRDATGRLQFAPGQWLYDKIGDITSPVLNWKYLQLKAASPELRRMLRDMKLQVEQAQETAAAVAGEAGKMTDAERAMVSDIVEKELKSGVMPPAHALQLAAMINDAMGKQTDELVRLGMLEADTGERLRGQYLPRFYESKLGKTVRDAWADSIGAMFRKPKAMQGIRGKHLRGRGMYETIPEGQLKDYEALGWEVRDPDYQPGLPTTDGTVQVWRDFTRQERDKMGEIRDAGFRFVMGYMQTQKDIALGRMFEAMASDPQMSSRLQTEKFGVQVPDTKAPGTQAKTYGKLAGRWVSQETMSQLSHVQESQNEALKLYRKAMGAWKEGKTVLNPVAHANNVLSNITMAHLAGVSYWRPDAYLMAIRDFVTKSKDIGEAKKAGLFLGTMSEVELLNTLPKELRELSMKQQSAWEKYTIGDSKLSAMSIMSFWLRKPMGTAYQAEDTFFRYLIWKDARNRGMDAGDAVDYAQKYIFTYDDLPKGARIIRDVGIPFFAYTYKAIPALLHTTLVHPDRMVAPAAVLWAANAAMYAIAAGGDDEDWDGKIRRYLTDPEYRAKVREFEKLERNLLPEWMKGTTSMMTPKALRLGTDEVTGLPLFLDMSRMIPGGDLFDVNPNAGGIPLPQPLTPSHPLFTIATAMLANKDLYFGKDLTDSNDTTGEKAAKRADWIWKQMSPAIAVNNYHWERGMNALAQASGGEVKYVPDAVGGEATGIGRDGLPVQPKYAAAQTFGIKVRPIDLDTAESIQDSLRKKMIRDIDAEMRRLRRLNANGAIADRVLERQIDRAQLKKERLREGLTVDGDEK